jgi:predicted  nucleic acid-binding Zn-ribbon protein
VAKKRTPSRKSASSSRSSSRKSASKKKSGKKGARPVRKAARKRAKSTGEYDGSVINLNPMKKELRAQIEAFEKRLGGAEARAAATPKQQENYEKLDQLKALNLRLGELCSPTMVIPVSS